MPNPDDSAHVSLPMTTTFRAAETFPNSVFADPGSGKVLSGADRNVGTVESNECGVSF